MPASSPLNKPVLSANLLLGKDLRELVQNFDDARIAVMGVKGCVFAHLNCSRCNTRHSPTYLIVAGRQIPDNEDIVVPLN